MDLLVIGTGYVGLVTGTCFAEMGHTVTCLDTNGEKIEKLKTGYPTIYEPGLESMILRNLKAKRLTFTTNYEESLSQCKVVFICVGTPVDENGKSDLSQVLAVSHCIADHINDYHLIIIKSTVPPGTTHKIQDTINQKLKEKKKNFEVDVISNPEFLSEGNAIHNFMKPDRIVVGLDDPDLEDVIKELYSPLMVSRDKLIIMDTVSSELTKYASNLMLASRISFMNELANVCELTGANIDSIRLGMGADPRIGYQYIYAGCGFGGSCFPKDLRSFINFSQSLGYNPSMMQAIDHVNMRQKNRVFEKMEQYFADKGGLEDKVIGVYGLSFKPETDDIREAPSLTLIRNLLDSGAKLKLFDPVAMDNAKLEIGHHEKISWCYDEMEAAKDVDAIALMTEWKLFSFMDIDQIQENMKGKAFFDGKNLFSSRAMMKRGFDYFCIGKKDSFSGETEKSRVLLKKRQR